MSCSKVSPMSISLVFNGNRSKELFEITQACIESGDAELNNIELDENGLISWEAINIESFEGFREAYGDVMSYSSLQAIHENPDSVHAYNTAYLFGRKRVVDKALAAEAHEADKSIDISP